MTAVPFAFLVHPRARLSDDLARVWPPLGRVPERLADRAVRRLPLPPVTMARVHLTGAPDPVGRVVLVPLGARHMLESPHAARDRVGAAVDLAVRRGASVVGLGALTATVTAGGTTLATRTDVGVTNGNAFTAAVVDDQLRSVLAAAPDRPRRVAVVGATGSVGTTLVRLLARDRAVEHLTLVARAGGRLGTLAGEVCRRVPTTVSTDLRDIRTCDVVVLLTASADALLRAEHLAPGVVVLDATQPRNTSPDLLVDRPDVTVLDGGVVDVPGLRLRGGDIGLPPGRSYACFAETVLLGLAGHEGHFALGVPTLEQVDHVRGLARRFADVGFRPAPPTTFGRPVPIATSTPADLRTRDTGGAGSAASTRAAAVPGSHAQTDRPDADAALAAVGAVR
ncbi:Semialdehyde dehydrogenase NAD - binding protein [Cellulomonas fimi]|uniref:Semialdehyde dehydrogenase NAD-binding protein n=1 Tax=Cellulomonas fimi (strain ATCC 484 / DSM 20113 / JCM 1341 / CCUG 24087 / LMG 16345 / NBRC 15513 / NCIMB 8980 / NCTC 7547 / NRS-133) TaxID=590998 RepID=F4H5M5_CELFA|nr:Semialdehyde dehydrogenase NAD - binding protein [Cellulomonas fimi]AEE44349.1 Semialdehyde dehydrogenase NAD - binding protein [Cellulomonas fimi ATCC 484]NNH08126.1 semialdehyde dehydrogenase [Cellulomonas fimi]VEH26177.1 acyl-ACP reductase [Cellulomonas fimi]